MSIATHLIPSSVPTGAIQQWLGLAAAECDLDNEKRAARMVAAIQAGLTAHRTEATRWREDGTDEGVYQADDLSAVADQVLLAAMAIANECAGTAKDHLREAEERWAAYTAVWVIWE